MAFTPETFVLCSKFNLFKAHANLWIYTTADTLEDCLVEHYFQPRLNLKNQDSPEVGDVIQCIVEHSKLAYLKIVEKTEKPYYITVARTFLENEADIMADITALQLEKASKDGDFVTAITDTNLGITQAEQTELENKIDTAANSGRMITPQGFWYAKMYAGTTPPSAENGTNYADFSQVDGQGNPIIVTYNRTGGAWVQDQTITPPADYDGYVPITSKIWDIAEQDGQQGGRILWNHTSKQFTPYPNIVSFDSIEITGDSTVDMPQNPSDDNIANVGFVKNTVGTARNIGDIFFTSRKDSTLNAAVECNGDTYNTTDFSGAQNIGQLLALNKIPYVSLATYASLLSSNGSVGAFGWDGVGTTAFRVPTLKDIFIETGTAAQIGNYISAGIPDFSVNLLAVDMRKNGVDGTQEASFTVSSGAGTHYERSVNIKGSDSSGVYGNSATVQPKSVRYRAMVQLAVSTTDEAVETCTNVLSDIAGLKNLSNLTSVGKNIGNWSTNVSNCITQIPQDIKLTLASGTITLKAGSKVYVPNGSGTFNTVTIANDITVSAVANRKTTIFYKNGALQRMNTEYCYSGATAPTPGAATAIWYDTTNNVIKFTSDSGSTWTTDNISLPICVATETTTGFTSIDQIFNGFGFVGASVFALPGVKGMIPNGRNADGTLKNTEFTLSNVLVTTDSSGATGALEFYLNNSGIYRSNVGTNTYNEALNIITNSSGVQQNVVSLDTNAYRTNGAVTSFKPKYAFRAVDCYDFNQEVNKKVNKGHEIVSFQKPTSQNNYTWIREYADGWVEMGISEPIAQGTVNLPVTMSDMHYTVLATQVTTSNSTAVRIDNRTTTQFELHSTNNCVWEVKGTKA